MRLDFSSMIRGEDALSEEICQSNSPNMGYLRVVQPVSSLPLVKLKVQTKQLEPMVKDKPISTETPSSRLRVQE